MTVNAPVRAPSTRSRVLAVALRLIAENGYAATSTRELSESLGFTKAALYYHFKSKDELLAALLAPVRAALSELVGRRIARTPAARRSVAAGYVELVAEHADLIRVLVDDPSVRTHPVAAELRTMYPRLFHLLAGTSSPDTATLARARAATGAVHAAMLRAEPTADPAVLSRAALSSACGALGLLAPRRPPRTTRPAASR